MLAKFAERNNVTTVVYDDTDQSFVDRFPWRQFRDRLEYKLEERGITLEVAAKSDTAGGDDEAEGAEAQDAE
jgi:transposase